MSASVINPHQLKLFMSGTEFKNASTSSVDLGFASPGQRAPTTMPELWANKLQEAKSPDGSGAHGAGIYASMQEHGYRSDYAGEDFDKPTLIFGGHSKNPIVKQGEGHHRVAAAAEIERQSGGRRTIWMPVKYLDYAERLPTAPTVG